MSTVLRRRDAFAPFGAYFATPFVPAASFAPAAEILRDGDDAVIKLEAPGLDPASDINIELRAGRLVVSGERRDVHAEQRHGHAVREVRYGSFKRSFTVPAGTTADAVSASYDKGVLSIRIAGLYAGSAPTRIPVQGGAPAAPSGQAEANGNAESVA